MGKYLIRSFSTFEHPAKMILAETYIYVSNVSPIVWEKPRDWFGSKLERAELVQHIKLHAAKLPVTVQVTRLPRHREDSFKCLKIEGKQHVLLANGQFRIAIAIDDVIPLIRDFILENNLMEKETHKFMPYKFD
jgi:hypothetical protein